MKSPYVSELQPGQVITGAFLVQTKDIRQKKTGEPYLSLMLTDRTGELDGKMWDNCADVMETFERDDFVRVRGLLQVHQNRLQLTIHKLQRVSPEEVDFSDYFPASERNPDEMFIELEQIVAGIGNPHLRNLVGGILSDPDIRRRYRIAPAAKMIHHAYLGGLLEHVLSLCGLCRMMASHYRNLDLDLLLAGAVLHDLGKIYELSYDRSFGYSSEGQLLGHIIISLRLIGDKIGSLGDFPPKLRMLLEHMVISHHGELEFGSPKVPLFPEALLLHHLDNLDSKMECMRVTIEKDRQMDGCWTGYVGALERMVLKKSKFLADSEPVPLSSRASAPGTAPAARVEAPVRMEAPAVRASAPGTAPAARVEPPVTAPAARVEAPARAERREPPGRVESPHPQQARLELPGPAGESRPEKNSSPFAEKLQLALRKETT